MWDSFRGNGIELVIILVLLTIGSVVTVVAVWDPAESFDDPVEVPSDAPQPTPLLY